MGTYSLSQTLADNDKNYFCLFVVIACSFVNAYLVARGMFVVKYMQNICKKQHGLGNNRTAEWSQVTVKTGLFN